MVGTEDFTWKDDKLYLKGKDTKFKIGGDAVEDSEKVRYRICWPDGIWSEDHYNLTWAKEHCISQASIHFNNTEKGTSGARRMRQNSK